MGGTGSMVSRLTAAALIAGAIAPSVVGPTFITPIVAAEIGERIVEGRAPGGPPRFEDKLLGPTWRDALLTAGPLIALSVPIGWVIAVGPAMILGGPLLAAATRRPSLWKRRVWAGLGAAAGLVAGLGAGQPWLGAVAAVLAGIACALVYRVFGKNAVLVDHE